MSRTYRKTSTKQGHPRYWGVRSMAKMDHTKAKKPKPYTVKGGLYETIMEQRVVDYTYWCPEELRIYVSKGTPHAIEELGAIIEQQIGYWCKRETSLWYLTPPPKTETYTRKRYIGRNPEYSWDDQSKVWDAQRLFDHVCRNRTGGRSRAMERSIKRYKSRERRLEGKEFIRTYIHEDHIWHDDFTYEDDDWYDEIPDNWNFWEDEIESKIDDPYNGYDSWDYDRTDYEYDYWTY